MKTSFSQREFYAKWLTDRISLFGPEDNKKPFAHCVSNFY